MKKPAQVLKAALEKIIARLASDVIELSLQGRLNALNIEADIARQKKRVLHIFFYIIIVF